MKKIVKIGFIVLAALGTFSCTDDEQATVDKEVGIITGQDPRFCMCCGGWFIDIGDRTYRFYELPGDSNIDLTDAALPMAVNVVWEADDNACLGDEIILRCAEKLAPAK